MESATAAIARTKAERDLAKLDWKAADKMRGNLDAAEYKHVVLGLIFLKYIFDAFESRRAQLEKLCCDPDSDYYIEDDAQRASESIGPPLRRES